MHIDRHIYSPRKERKQSRQCASMSRQIHTQSSLVDHTRRAWMGAVLSTNKKSLLGCENRPRLLELSQFPQMSSFYIPKSRWRLIKKIRKRLRRQHVVVLTEKLSVQSMHIRTYALFSSSILQDLSESPVKFKQNIKTKN